MNRNEMGLYLCTKNGFEKSVVKVGVEHCLVCVSMVQKHL